MLSRYIVVLATLLVLVAAVELSAQSVALGPQVGLQKAQDADKARLTFGAALRAKVGPALGLEGSIGYHKARFVDGLVSVTSWPVMVTGMIYPLPMVYGLAGAGWYNTTVEYELDDATLVGFEKNTKQKFGWHFGGGLEVPVGERTRFTGDIRYVFLDYDFETVPGAGDFNGDYYFINAGFLFKL